MSIFGGIQDHFGLDIGANSLRVVQLSGGGDKFTLSAFGKAPLPPGISQSDSKIDIQKIGKTLNALLEKSGISTKNVVAAIPGTSVFNSVVKLPPMSSKELSKAIEYQAEQNLPVKLDEIKYDWQIIRQDPTTKEMTVMIIAATKNKIQAMVELFNYANLNLIALETSTVALARSMSNENDSLVMVLDIGANTTEIAIVEKGVLMQTRSFPLAGYAMTRAVSQNLRLELDQADQFKMKFGLSQDKLEGQVYRALEPIVKNILEEASRSSKFYQENFNQTIGRIVLTGGASRLPLLPDYIKSILNVEVTTGSPWTKVSYQANLSDKLNEIAPEFSTAVGLAMRD